MGRPKAATAGKSFLLGVVLLSCMYCTCAMLLPEHSCLGETRAHDWLTKSSLNAQQSLELNAQSANKTFFLTLEPQHSGGDG
jgi:hypothetical protein